MCAQCYFCVSEYLCVHSVFCVYSAIYMWAVFFKWIKKAIYVKILDALSVRDVREYWYCIF